jgi:cysteinyl-tRNA synthetase
MASEILGKQIDIHSGGVDLMFPHHDNELAQSEAFHQCGQWINYFLHTGHLHIEGLKMSKSLKNFISIDEALQRFSPRRLRLAFLLQSWSAKMDFRESAMAEVKGVESTLNVGRAERGSADGADAIHRTSLPRCAATCARTGHAARHGRTATTITARPRRSSSRRCRMHSWPSGAPCATRSTRRAA